MALVWRKDEILVVEESDSFFVQLAENNDLIFWELVDTRYVGDSETEIVDAQEQEVHPTEDTLMVRNATGYTQLYRKIMRVQVVPKYQAALLSILLLSAPAA